MNRIKCIIVDDDEVYCDFVAELVNSSNIAKVDAMFLDPIKALQYLNSNSVDLIISDVHMPNLSGLQMVSCIGTPPEIVLMSSHLQYASDGYNIGALDFLLKPFSKERLDKCLEKALKAISNKVVGTTEIKNDDFIWVKSKGEYIKLYFNNILYVEAQKDFLKIETDNQGSIIIYATLKLAEQMLIPLSFIKCHRSFIVNKNKITRFSTENLYLDKISIPLGNNFKENVTNNLISDNVLER